METINTKVNWFNVSLYYIIAFVISAPFNSGLLSQNYQALTKGYLISNWTFLPAGIGTLIAALVAFYFDKRHTKTITIFGNNRFKNIAIALTPLLVFTIAGLTNEHQISNNYYGFVFASITLIYALTEEVFWRSYLQDALRPLGRNLSYFLIGISWWAWHFRFNSTFDWTAFLLICIGSTFLLGKFAEETKSFFTTAGLHSLIILTTTTGEMTNSKIIGGVITILIWLSIGKWWKTETEKTRTETLTRE